MSTLQEQKALTSDLCDRTMTLNLLIQGQDTFSVRSCEVVGRWFRNRISFQENRCMNEVLVSKLANSLRANLQRLPEGTHVLSLPEFLVELPGLALSGLHLMITEGTKGTRNAILRFTEFVGAVNAAFQIDTGMQAIAPSYGDRLAMNVLEEICLPILNMSRSFPDFSEGEKRALPRDFADRAREFEFQTELLKRYIFSASTSQYSAAHSYIEGPRQSPENFILE